MDKQFFEWQPEFDDRWMLIDEAGRKITYREARSFGQTYLSGLKKHALILILTRNAIGSVLFYICALRKGLVPMLLDARADQAACDEIMRSYQPDYVAAPEDMEWKLPAGSQVLGSSFDYNLYDLNKEHGADLHEDLALLLSTSGSTGSPKMVRQSRRNLEMNTKAICDFLRIQESDRAITTLPMHYTYGLSIINTHIYMGASILLTSRSLVEMAFWDFFKAEAATSFGGVPYTYQLLKNLRIHRMALPSLRYMTQAGGKLDREIQKYMTEYAAANGKQFIVMYGQTEATARMTYLPWESAREKLGSIGLAIPYGRVQIEDAEGKRITEPYEKGELIYYGPNVTMGYATERSHLSKGDGRQGRLATGDLAYCDQDGFFYITGRKNRFIKILGNRISLDEAESLLKETFPGADFACTGEDERMDVYFSTDRQTGIHEEQVKEYLSEKLHLFPSLFAVYHILAIPRKVTGKIDYGRLKTCI